MMVLAEQAYHSWGAGIPLFVIVFVAVMIIRMRSGARTQRTCGGCGAMHPLFARFCRRCGRRL